MPRSNGLHTTVQNVKRTLLRFGRVPLALLVIWIYTVWWGEHATFAGHIQECTWHKWETWQQASNPHHVLLVADPQIVDPHTYPDRPWPLSTLTVLYTDLYLKRAYRALLCQLQPDSTVFLGDLFDGGREWGTKGYSSPDPHLGEEFKQYGQDFWLEEYGRFQNMFVKTWHDAGMAHLPGEGGRRLIASLPGNHDLGFGQRINPHVKSRFDAHFGPLNRIDILGNHTFVSLDTVSLSAMDEADPVTGAFGTGDGLGGSKSAQIWKPVESYLNDAKMLREREIKREIRQFGARSSFPELRKAASDYPLKFAQTIEHLATDHEQVLKSSDPLKISTSQFPTIILTHVPFYRDADKDCGPLRERGKSISISNGYQYQNVLTPLVTKDIVDKLDAAQISMVYSGDDHDYCEIEHNEFTGRIREITVKSMSWAMGVRRPGVQLVSLWNPVDLAEAMISSGYGVPTDDKEGRVLNMPKGTVQNHLCLLPDQLGIFIRYGELLGFTLIVLLIRALLWKPASVTYKQDLESDQPLLPVTNPYLNDNKHAKQAAVSSLHAQPVNGDTISSNLSTSAVTSRKSSGVGAYGYLPPEARSRSTSPSKTKFHFQDDSDDWGNPTTSSDRIAYARAHHDPSQLSLAQWLAYHVSNWWIFRSSRTKLGEFLTSMMFIGLPVLSLYFWLMRCDM